MTARDKLQRIADLARKATRHGWIVAAIGAVGAALTLTFVAMRPSRYQSAAVLFYQERIQSSLLAGREEQSQRNIGDRYRELLLARAQLHQIVTDPRLTPFPAERNVDVAIDKLRERIRFEARGASVFRIGFTDNDPDRARRVTERLTGLLQARDEELRNDQAKATVQFALEQKEAAQRELAAEELALTGFLARHPEFAQAAVQAAPYGQLAGEGASIRAIGGRGAPHRAGSVRILALERQRRRLQARLDAPIGTRPSPAVAPPPERLAADAELAAARADLASASRELTAALTQYTDQHPAAIRARERADKAEARVRRAQAAPWPGDSPVVAPASELDREFLERELAAIEQQIAAAQRQDPEAPPPPAVNTDWVVQLETDHARLRRAVIEQRERVDALASTVFRAQMDANTKLAESGGRLRIVDPAFTPVRPSGPSRTLLVLAGIALFLALGASAAIGLAVIDDRLYRDTELDELGVPVLAVIPKRRRGEPRPSRARARRGAEALTW